jgi:hypothetical protein
MIRPSSEGNEEETWMGGDELKGCIVGSDSGSVY